MHFTLKRILLLLGFFAVVGLLGFGLWYFFFRPIEPTDTKTSPDGITNNLPRAGGASSTPASFLEPGSLPTAELIDGEGSSTPSPAPTTSPTGLQANLVATNITHAISVSPNNRGVVRYFDQVDGRFYYALPDGGKAPLSNKQFFGVETVTWGKNTDKAILAFPDGSKLFYNFETDTQAPLPFYWEDIDFSPEDNQIVAKSLGKSRSNRFLITANPDGTEAKAIEELGDNQDKVQISWSPNNQMIAFSHTAAPLGQDREAVLLIGKDHENFQSLVTDGRGLIPLWSPSGKVLAYSVYNTRTGYRPLLWVSGASSENVNAGRRNLSVFTWADKCAWASEVELLCGVPRELGEGAALQRDLFDTGPDVLYRMNIATGQATILGPIEGNGAVRSISISPGDTNAFVTEKRTGKLFKISL